MTIETTASMMMADIQSYQSETYPISQHQLSTSVSHSLTQSIISPSTVFYSLSQTTPNESNQYYQQPPPLQRVNQFEIEPPSGFAYPEQRRSTPMGFASLSSSSSTNVASLYCKLTPIPTHFGKDKKPSYSYIEKYLNRYNRRLTSSARSALCIFVVGTLISLFLLIYGLVNDLTFRVTLESLVIALSAIVFAFWILAWILKFDEGTAEMREVADPIHEGSEGFFIVQYGTISKISFIFAGLIFILYVFRDPSSSAVNTGEISSFSLGLITSSTFMFGSLCSALAGYSGMWVSVRANVRVASAARRCYNDALQLCFRGGAFSSIINVALAVGGISLILSFLTIIYPNIPFVRMPLLLVGYGFGASLVAMFAQLGGGIYTKAADVGADLVGKIEAGN